MRYRLLELLSRALLLAIWLVVASLVCIVVLLAFADGRAGPRLGPALSGGVVVAIGLGAVRWLVIRAAGPKRPSSRDR